MDASKNSEIISLLLLFCCFFFLSFAKERFLFYKFLEGETEQSDSLIRRERGHSFGTSLRSFGTDDQQNLDVVIDQLENGSVASGESQV